jgi:hypothetical protein
MARLGGGPRRDTGEELLTFVNDELFPALTTLRVEFPETVPDALIQGLAQIGQSVELAFRRLAITAAHRREIVAVDRGCASGDCARGPLESGRAGSE